MPIPARATPAISKPFAFRAGGGMPCEEARRMTDQIAFYVIIAAMAGIIVGLSLGCWIAEVRTRNLIGRFGRVVTGDGPK